MLPKLPTHSWTHRWPRKATAAHGTRRSPAPPRHRAGGGEPDAVPRGVHICCFLTSLDPFTLLSVSTLELGIWESPTSPFSAFLVPNTRATTNLTGQTGSLLRIKGALFIILTLRCKLGSPQAGRLSLRPIGADCTPGWVPGAPGPPRGRRCPSTVLGWHTASQNSEIPEFC